MINHMGRPMRAFRFRVPALGGLAALTLSLAACMAPPPPPPAARPATPAPAPRPTPAPPPRPATPPVDWRDATPAAGTWRYRSGAPGGLATFVAPDGRALLSLRCDLAARALTIVREGLPAVDPQPAPEGPAPASAEGIPAQISAATQQRRLVAHALPIGANEAPQIALTLPAQDSLLDALAFSRGRFAVDIYGAPMLVLPAWAEVARVVEDCR